MTGAWRPTVAFVSAAGTVLAVLLLAVALHRPDLVVLAAPLFVWLIVALLRRRGTGLTAGLRAATSSLFEDQAAAVRLSVTAPPGAELITATVKPGLWLQLRDPASAAVVPATAGRPTVVEFGVRALRWGRTRTGTAAVSATTGQGLLRCEVTAAGSTVRVVPYRERFDAIDALPVTSGVLGAHRTRRPGEGSDLAGVRRFVVGDRLKRINWPVSLRTGALHATATVTDLDATIMLVVDSSTDVVADVAAPIGGTLDTAVHAAASIAEHYLRTGDRVGIVDDAQSMRTVLPAAGRRHLDRIVDALIDVDSSPARRREPLPIARLLARTAPRAIVFLITPLLELARPALAIEIALAGHPVLVVDTLGDRIPVAEPGPSSELAARLQLLQHAHDIDRLADFGIPVVPWRGAGSLNSVLRSLSRASAASRLLS